MAMYCEGGRSRTGKLADEAKPGIGRLALETGATVVPIAIHGSSKVRNWKRLEFPKVTIQYGDPFRYEQRRRADARAGQGDGQRDLRRHQGALPRPGGARAPRGRRARAPKSVGWRGQAGKKRTAAA